MKFAKLAILATALAATPIAANAQEAGQTVYGNDGNPIGTVESVANDVVMVNTGKHMAPLPLNLFGTSEEGPTLNITATQLNDMLDAQAAEAEAKLDAALIEGAALVSADSQPAGMVQSVDADADVIVVERDTGLVSMKREHFVVDANGALMARFTLAQIDSFTVGAEAAASAE
ncbi:hypothetical protein BPTFM16_01170 [Altererythrobacter insulae]|nr:hypothetical protein BPTFM16_01170 [Altererythrobacter insulae]